MKKAILLLMLAIFSLLIILTAYSLPEGAVARLGKSSIGRLAFSPDGSVLAVGTASDIEFRDPITLEEIGRLETEITQYYFCFSPDGNILASSSGRNIIKLWDVAQSKEIDEIKIIGDLIRIGCIRFSPDGKLLAFACGHPFNSVGILNMEAREEIAILGHPTFAHSLCFSPDGTLLASGLGDGTLKIWNVETQREIATSKAHRDMIRSVDFSPDGTLLATTSSDGNIKLWDVTSWKEIANLEHSPYVYSAIFGPDGNILASGAGDGSKGTIKLWDVAKLEEIAKSEGHSSNISSLSFSPDGKFLASSSTSMVKLWDMESRKESKGVDNKSYPAVSLAFSPDSKSLAGGSSGGKVQIWDVTSYNETALLNIGSDSIQSIRFSPDGKRLSIGSYNGKVIIWDAKSLKITDTLERTPVVSAIDFSPDSKLLAIAGMGWGGGGFIHIWDIEKQKNLSRLDSSGFFSVAFSPDGKLIAGGGWDCTAGIWDTVELNKIAVFKGHITRVKSVCFSPNGKMLVSASDDAVKLWDVATHKEIGTLAGASEPVRFSPDGSVLATKGDVGLGGGNGVGERTVKLWNVSDQKEIASFVGHSWWISAIAFSPNGKLLASVSSDGILLWDMTPYVKSQSIASEGKVASQWGGIKSESLHHALGQNYPNPFNPETWIPYQLAEDSDAAIDIYNSSGQLVRTLKLGDRKAGNYQAYWNGKDDNGQVLASGVYFYILKTIYGFTDIKKMVIVK